MKDRSVPALTNDEMDTVRVMVEHDWRFTPDPRFIRQVLEEDSASRLTIIGARHYGWLSSGVPESILGDFARALVGEGIPEILPSYEAWQAWKARVKGAHVEWVRKRDESEESGG
ncbi:hypothetical protein [Streptomyces sp. NPDC091027]|uniref:hypothetical protein n=1 Tax=Streptomyces sp. NPDC091027 TaxID=3365971 RepID=UPI0038049F82